MYFVNINKTTVKRKLLERLNYIIFRSEFDYINKWWRVELRKLHDKNSFWNRNLVDYNFSFVETRTEKSEKNRDIIVLYIHLEWYLKGVEFYKNEFRTDYENKYEINVLKLLDKNYFNTIQSDLWHSNYIYSKLLNKLNFNNQMQNDNNKISHIFKKRKINFSSLDINSLDIWVNEVQPTKDNIIKNLHNLRDFLIHWNKYYPTKILIDGKLFESLQQIEN